jgi:hypothetical protein
MTCAAVAANKHGYYRIHRDSAETWGQIDKNISNISENFDTIKVVGSELIGQIEDGIKTNGVRKEVKTHQKFYYPIIFFCILYLIWLKSRDK